MTYENKAMDLGFSPSKTAAIVFQDKREEVLTGKEKPSFCGHSNSSMQISYNIQTNSGKPLADEFAFSVTSSYNKSNVFASALLVNMNTSADSAQQVFKAGNTERLLYFTIYKWESRAMPLVINIRYEVICKLELKLYDKRGELLASNTVQDIVVKEQGAATSMKKMQEMADDVFSKQVRLLLSKEEVRKNL
jgi:hypothetical protein